MFNIIARRTLLDFCKSYPEAALALMGWYHEMIVQDFKNFQELKMVHRNCSVIGDDRVVFNISGNKYRLVVRVVFSFRTIQVKWFGTHQEYDKIDVKTFKFKKNN